MQSWPEPVGKILSEPWENIWNQPICVKLREHGFAESGGCRECVHNEVCGGGCPLERGGEK
jgi:radical SAM protein with 4Fe4S-binding SPASM domain